MHIYHQLFNYYNHARINITTKWLNTLSTMFYTSSLITSWCTFHDIIQMFHYLFWKFIIYTRSSWTRNLTSNSWTTTYTCVQVIDTFSHIRLKYYRNVGSIHPFFSSNWFIRLASCWYIIPVQLLDGFSYISFKL